MATPFSILAWRIPWTEEPGGSIVHGACFSSLKELQKIAYLLYIMKPYSLALKLA